MLNASPADAELEKVDSRHAQLTRLSHQLVDSLTLYHTLMRDTGLQYPAPPQPGFSPAHPGADSQLHCS